MKKGEKIIGRLLVGLLAIIPLTGQGQASKALPVATINSAYDELMPVVAPDGKTLYFVRTGHPQNTGGETGGQDIWLSLKNKTATAWSAPVNAGPPLNNIYNNAVCGLNPDGQVIYLQNKYLPRNRMAPGLSVAHKSGAGWEFPQPVTIAQFNPTFGFLNFFPASDSILLLSAQTDTTHLEDLFICRRIGEKVWSAPERLHNLNTPGFEIAPVMAPDGQTLYFTSNGHGGMGDADIFRSRRLDNSWRNWSKPENLGPAVNTPGFDGYFTLDGVNGVAYFTRENENANTDIYFIRLVDITPANLITADVVPATHLAGAETAPAEAPSEPVLLNPVQVFFDVNSAALNSAALATLQALELHRQSNKKTIFIQGHADDTGTAAGNIKLSEKRAAAVATYLVNQGWPPTAMQVESFGSSLPLVPNLSARQRAQNRRVEIRIE